MANTGNIFPGTGENNAGIGATAWASPGNIVSDNATDATCTAAASSQYLVARNFNFGAIPSNARITGVLVRIEASESSGGTEALLAQLQDSSGALFGSSKSVSNEGNISGTGKAVYTYGSTTDLWGTTTITPAMVADPDFGVRFWYTTAHNVQVDFVTVALEWTLIPVKTLVQHSEHYAGQQAVAAFVGAAVLFSANPDQIPPPAKPSVPVISVQEQRHDYWGNAWVFSGANFLRDADRIGASRYEVGTHAQALYDANGRSSKVFGTSPLLIQAVYGGSNISTGNNQVGDVGTSRIWGTAPLYDEVVQDEVPGKLVVSLPQAYDPVTGQTFRVPPELYETQAANPPPTKIVLEQEAFQAPSSTFGPPVSYLAVVSPQLKTIVAAPEPPPDIQPVKLVVPQVLQAAIEKPPSTILAVPAPPEDLQPSIFRPPVVYLAAIGRPPATISAGPAPPEDLQPSVFHPPLVYLATIDKPPGTIFATTQPPQDLQPSVFHPPLVYLATIDPPPSTVVAGPYPPQDLQPVLFQATDALAEVRVPYLKTVVAGPAPPEDLQPSIFKPPIEYLAKIARPPTTIVVGPTPPEDLQPKLFKPPVVYLATIDPPPSTFFAGPAPPEDLQPVLCRISVDEIRPEIVPPPKTITAGPHPPEDLQPIVFAPSVSYLATVEAYPKTITAGPHPPEDLQPVRFQSPDVLAEIFTPIPGTVVAGPAPPEDLQPSLFKPPVVYLATVEAYLKTLVVGPTPPEDLQPVLFQIPASEFRAVIVPPPKTVVAAPAPHEEIQAQVFSPPVVYLAMVVPTARTLVALEQEADDFAFGWFAKPSYELYAPAVLSVRTITTGPYELQNIQPVLFQSFDAFRGIGKQPSTIVAAPQSPPDLQSKLFAPPVQYLANVSKIGSTVTGGPEPPPDLQPILFAPSVVYLANVEKTSSTITAWPQPPPDLQAILFQPQNAILIATVEERPTEYYIVPHESLYYQVQDQTWYFVVAKDSIYYLVTKDEG